MKRSYFAGRRILFALSALLLTAVVSSAQVTVNSTGGTATASYTTLRNAFTAINAGTHTGTITVGISANTTETGPCVLNSSGAGSASYTAISVFPTNDAVIVSGSTASGRGLIEFNGADNVTIDGDNPGTGGTNRNLTIKNTAAITVSLTSCVRFASSSIVTSNDNNTIRNLNLSGSGVGRNTAAYTTEVVTWGIIASGNASTISATAVPNPLTGSTVVIPSGQTVSNLTISNNTIQTASRGISINGSSTSVASSLIISNNVIGNATQGAVDQITGVGMTVQGTANGIISGNTVRVESYIVSASTNRAINVGLISTAGVSDVIIEKNTIERCRNNNSAKTRAAVGIDISGGNNHIIRNNFVSNCLNSQVSGTTAFTITIGIAGIRILGGTGHKIYNNTIHLTGAIPGSAGKNLAAALEITSLTSTGMDIRNNIFSNQLSGGNPALYNTMLVSVYLPSGGNSTLNMMLNNNTYYQGSLTSNGIAQVGTTLNAANFYKSVNFIPGAFSPATNFRSYSNSLSAAATNDNTSYASSNGTPVIAPTDLHISFASSELTNIDQKGDVSVPVTSDIDGDVRPSASTTNPDIGADEFTVPSCLSATGGTISPAAYSSCAGQTVILTATGASNALGITYQWMSSTTAGGPYSNVSGGSGANTASYTTPVLTAGTKYYILQATCSFGPVSGLSNEVTVTTNTLPVVTVTGANNFCSGGSVTLTGSAGGTLQWYVNDSLIAGATANTFVVTSAGSYNMIKTNASGCSDSAATGITVSVNPLPTVSSSTIPASGSICAGSNATLNGSGATSYTWTGGVTNGVSFTPGTTATYTVTGTDGNGCINTSTASITVNSLPSVTASATPATVCAGSNTTLSGSGANSYAWTGGITNGVSFTPVTSATYTVTGTDVNGCINTATRSITVNAVPNVNAFAMPATLCAGDNTTLTATGANAYTWTGGITNGVSFTPATSATYTVTGTDINGCTNTATQSVTVNAAPSVSTMAMPAAVCAGSSTTLMGTGANSYTWTGGITDGISFIPATSATYTVTGTDINGCTNTATQSVTVNAAPSVSTMAMPAAVCTGGSTTFMGMGANSYTWTGGITDGVSFTPATSATYTVTGTDLNGCTNTATQSITVNAVPNVNTFAMPATLCAGDNTTLTATGANAYTWSGGITNGVSFTPATSATYTVTGTDLNGCTNTATQSITVNAVPNVNAFAMPATLCAGDNTTLTGTGANAYAWTGGITDGVSFTPATSATYTVTGTDLNGCTNTATQSVTVNAAPNVSTMAMPAAVCTGGSTTFMGMGANSYTWTGGITNGVSFTPATSATYTVTGTDLNGCTNTATQSVTVNTLPAVSANASAAVICAGSNETLNGGGASLYTWDNSVTDGVAFTPAVTTTYNVTGTDMNGCMDTASVTVTVNTAPSVTFTPFTMPVCDNDIAFSLTGGAPAGGIYSGTAVSSGMFDPAIAGSGMYLLTYSVTDVNSCMGSDTATISVSVCSGMNATNNTEEIMLYPNPSEGIFSIRIINSVAAEISLSITDVQGKVVYSSLLSGISAEYKKEISLADISKGVYFVRLRTTKEVMVQKLIIQ